MVFHMPAGCNVEFHQKINKKKTNPETGSAEIEKHLHAEKEAQREGKVSPEENKLHL